MEDIFSKEELSVYLSRCVVFDTETTGLSPKDGHRIVEIGMVEIINGLPTGEELHYYLNPERDVPLDAERVHGLSTEFLLDKPLFSEAVKDLRAFMGESPLIAHNAEFDMAFLNNELQKIKKKPLNNKVIDTLVLARQRHPGRAVSLDHLCNLHNIDTSKRQKHGALLDAQLLAKVFSGLIGGEQQGFSLENQSTFSPEGSDLSLESMSHLKDRVPRSPPPLLEEEKQAHQEMLGKMKKPLWFVVAFVFVLMGAIRGDKGTFLFTQAFAQQRIFAFNDLPLEQKKIVKTLEQWMKGQQEVSADFDQFDENGQETKGKFYMLRPYHMMFDYGPPLNIKVYSVRHWIVVVDKKTKEQNVYPISDTPFKFFLRTDVDLTQMKIGYWGVFNRQKHVYISMIDTENQKSGSVSFEFLTYPMRLSYIKTQNEQGKVVEVRFSNINAHANVPYSLFPQPQEFVPSHHLFSRKDSKESKDSSAKKKSE